MYFCYVKNFIFILLFTLSFISLLGQNIVINEFMSSNYNFLLDYDGDGSDWIELYNPTDETINLSSYFISDNLEKPHKWSFPDVQIAPDSFLVIFASGKDIVYPENEIHTNFSIKAYGEDLLLSNSSQIIHQIEPFILRQNQSYGFLPDGSDEAVIFDVATPGAKNELILIEKVSFSIVGGIYDNNFEIELSNVFSENEIRYTIDGNMPNENSLLYSDALFLDEEMCSKTDIYKIQISPPAWLYIPEKVFPKAIVIRAAAFDSIGVIQSRIVTNSYFIRDMEIDHLDLPIVSITADYNDLFDDSTGIFVPGIFFDENYIGWAGNYFQKGENWEKKSNVEMYDGNNCVFNECTGLRTHGGMSRIIPQKGMKFYARSEYGSAHINAKIFEESDLMTFDNLVLRPFCSAKSDFGAHDYVFLKIASQLNCTSLNTRPVCVYLNGEYWGIYFLLERVDDDFLNNNFGVDNADIIESWSGSIVSGDNENFLQLYDFLLNNDLSDNSNYYYVANQINISSVIDYYLLEIFSANTDWPANNMRCWRDKDDGKWEWVPMDGDACFVDVDYNSFEHATNLSDDLWPTNASSTLLFRSLMSNEIFAYNFVQRFKGLSQNQFNYVNTSDILSEISDKMQPEISAQVDRFNEPVSYESWNDNYYIIDDYLDLRNCKMAQHFTDVFGYEINLPGCQDNDDDINMDDDDTDDDVKANDLVLYPNPTQESFCVYVKSDFLCSFKMIILDVSGNVITERTEFLQLGDNQFCFDKLGLDAGIYFVNCHFLEKVVSEKLVVIR
ncbi:MAG: CotH kinase family protein [Bacteroidales bacterium]|nr:CotH kinase family protein [Bacteroidales bacterium]